MHQVLGPAETAACRHTLLAQVSVLLVLLVWWLDAPKKEGAYQVTEFFSGVGRIATIAKHTGLKSVAYDIDYGVHWCSQNPKIKRSPMDLNGNGGLVFPGSCLRKLCDCSFLI